MDDEQGFAISLLYIVMGCYLYIRWIFLQFLEPMSHYFSDVLKSKDNSHMGTPPMIVLVSQNK